MKVLLDTNIIIDRESTNVSNFSISTLYKWIDKLKYTKYIHPSTTAEISNYHDKKLVDILKIKLESYELLIPDDDFRQDFRLIVGKYKNDKNS